MHVGPRDVFFFFSTIHIWEAFPYPPHGVASNRGYMLPEGVSPILMYITRFWLFSIFGLRYSSLASEMFESLNGMICVDGEFILAKFIVFIFEELVEYIIIFIDEEDWSLVSTSVFIAINKFLKMIRLMHIEKSFIIVHKIWANLVCNRIKKDFNLESKLY